MDSRREIDSEYSLDKETRERVEKVFKSFLNERYISDISNILSADELKIHYAVVVDCTALFKVDIIFAKVLIHHHDETLRILDGVLADVCMDLYKANVARRRMTKKPYTHIRMKNLPPCDELWRHRVPKSKDVGKFLAVEGTVIRTGAVKLLQYKKSLICLKCHGSFEIDADLEQCYRVPTPARCPITPNCNSKKFVMSKDSLSGHDKKDLQEIKVQEQVRKLAMGMVPRAISAVLEDDLVDSCKAGDDVIIYGVVKRRWQPLHEGKVCDIELIIKANYMEIRNDHRLDPSVREDMQNDFECFWACHVDTPLTARNQILASFCPQIYGLYVVKLAVALILAGGVAKKDPSGSRVRGEAHLLLVGDPGTGKSQFLKYAAKITPRSVLTTGIGSTSAGLTVTAVRDGAHWALEAGALVLADGGVCCIDEFSGIRERDRGAIHEAMEQQTVSVAKAGLVCKLNTRTSVLAATNPKLGKYDDSVSMDVNVAIASPLLSRFDIILVLLDKQNEDWDSIVADYVLSGKTMNDMNFSADSLWSLDQMQAYFTLIKQINPVLTPDANTILSQYYQCHRKSDFRNAARTTIRLLESLIRIAEAHARLMYRNTVEIIDAVTAVLITESSMQGASLLPTGNILHSQFPADPEEQCKQHTALVLKKLELEHLIQKGMVSSPTRPTTVVRKSCKEPENEDFTSTVQKIVSRGFGTQGYSLQPKSSLDQPTMPFFAHSATEDEDLSYGEFGLALKETDRDQSLPIISTQVHTSAEVHQSPPPNKTKRTHSPIDRHPALQRFRRYSSSPEERSSSIGINSSDHKILNSRSLDPDDMFQIGVTPTKAPKTPRSVPGSSVKSLFVPSVFSLEDSKDDSFLQDEVKEESSTSAKCDAAFRNAKHSSFTLDGSMVEKICDDIAHDNRDNLQPFVTGTPKNTLTTEIKQECEQPLVKCESKQECEIEPTPQSVFRIDEDIDLDIDFDIFEI